MKHLKTFFNAMLLLAVFSCSKNTVAETGNGQVLFKVSSIESITDKTKSNVSDYTVLPFVEEFTLNVTDSESAPVWNGKVSEWDSATQLPVGNYNVTASYGTIDEEGFDKPYFSGTKSFAIVGGQAVEVPVPVTLMNTVVKISCTQNFMNYYKDYTFKITRNGAEVVTFTKEDVGVKGAFVDGYKLTLEGTLTSEVKTQTFSKEYTNLDATTAYSFEFDVNNVGGTSITINFNDYVEPVELGDVELNE